MSLLSSFKSFDAYPKTLDDFREKWAVGAVISVISVILILFIVIGEVGMYGHVLTKHGLHVDTDVSGHLDVHLNITFNRVPCVMLNQDSLDSFGESMPAVGRNLSKIRLSGRGEPVDTHHLPEWVAGEDVEQHKKDLKVIEKTQQKDYCGSCYGTREDAACCNTCQELRQAHNDKGWRFPRDLYNTADQCAHERMERAYVESSDEGCMIYGDIQVTRTQGVIFLSPARSMSKQGVSLLSELGLEPFPPSKSVAHTINKLAFGKEFPGVVNPLDGREHTSESHGLFQYHIKIVPTRFENIHGDVLETNQYSVTEHVTNKQGDSGVYLQYDLSPVKVHVKETRMHGSFLHFFVSLCAAVGGVFTVAGLVDSMLFHGHQTLSGKRD